MTPARRAPSDFLPTLLGLLICAWTPARPAQDDAGEAPPRTGEPCARALLERPGGPLAGCLQEGTPVRVEERLPGWVRVRVEGWLRESEAAALPAPRGKAAVAGTAVGKEGSPAAGAVVRLLARAEDLETALASLRQWHGTEREAVERRLSEVEHALDRALFSSENLMQAKQTQSQLRAEQRALDQQRLALREQALAEAVALFERHQVASTASDAGGYFLLEGIEPGSYRLLVAAGLPGQAPSWYLPLDLQPGERRRLDLDTLKDRDDPFSGFQ